MYWSLRRNGGTFRIVCYVVGVCCWGVSVKRGSTAVSFPDSPLHVNYIHITGDYWRLLGITEHYRRDYRGLLETTGDYWRLLRDYRALMEITGDYWRLLEITGLYWRLLRDYWRSLKFFEITGDYWILQQITGDYWLLEINGDCPRLSKFTEGYWT